MPIPSPQSETAETPRLDGVAVLVVDDEPGALEVVRAILEHHGARVRTVDSAQHALDAIARSVPDVLVSDINMPDRDGYWLIEQIRLLPADRGGRMPAAALTAYTAAEDRMRALKAGFQLHVPKPVVAGHLATVVAALARPTG
jgi:CheY-like chemotaxis protein